MASYPATAADRDCCRRLTTMFGSGKRSDLKTGVSMAGFKLERVAGFNLECSWLRRSPQVRKEPKVLVELFDFARGFGAVEGIEKDLRERRWRGTLAGVGAVIVQVATLAEDQENLAPCWAALRRAASLSRTALRSAARRNAALEKTARGAGHSRSASRGST